MQDPRIPRKERASLLLALRCELYEPMQRLDKLDISNYFIIAP